MFLFGFKDLARRRRFLFYFLILLGHFWFAWFGRIQILGPVKDYSYYFLQDPDAFIKRYPLDFSLLSPIITFILPTAVLFYLLIRQHKKISDFFTTNWQAILLWLSLFGPGFAGRFLSGSWHQYYNATMVLALVGFLFIFWRREQRLTKKHFVISLLICVLGIFDDYRVFAQSVWDGVSNRCFDDYKRSSADPHFKDLIVERRQNLERIFLFVQSQSQTKDQRFLVSDSLVPTLTAYFPQSRFFMLGGTRIKHVDHFNYMIFERQGLGAPYPLSSTQIESILQSVKSKSSIEVVYESRTLIILKGHIEYQPISSVYTSEIMKSISGAQYN